MEEIDNKIQYKILVVEDNKIINNLIQKALNKLGYETHGVFYGKEAVNFINKNIILDEYILLIDYLLPDIYGGEFVDKLIDKYGKINFIILTGYGDEKVAVEMMKKGALDYVVKEENFIDLLPSIISQAVKEINQERKINNVESELKYSCDLLKNITANLPNYIYWKDINLKYLGCNENYAKLIGFNKSEDIMNKNDNDLGLSTNEVESFKKFDMEAIENNKSIIEMEEINIKPSDNKISILTNRIPITNSSGKINGVIFIGTDVTELNEIDESIRVNELRYRELFNNIRSGVAVYEAKNKGDDFLLKDINSAGEKIDDLKKNDVIGKKIIEIYPKSKQSGLFDFIQRVFFTGQPEHILIVQESNDNITFKELYSYKLPSEEIIIVYDDITEKKQNQELLEEYKLAIESSNDNIAAINQFYKLIFVNQEFIKNHQLRIEKIKGRHIEEIFGNDLFKNIIKPNFDNCLNGKTAQFEMEMKYEKKGLRTLWINLYPLKIDIKKKENKGVVAIITDITDRKISENKIKEQYNFIQSLIETIPNPIYYIDQNGRYLGCNRSFEELFNFKKANIINKTVFDITPKDLAAKHKEMDDILLKNPGTQVYKWTLKDKDNNLREAIYNKATFNDSNGNVIGLIGLITDITAIIKKEEALKESENKYKILVEGSPNIFYIFSSKRGTLYWSPRVESILGFTDDDLKKNPFIWYNSIHPDDIKKVDKIIKDKGENKNQIIDIEYRIKDKKGNLRWLHDCIISKKIVDKEIITEGNITDITERKKSDDRQSLIIKILQLLNKKEESINIIQKILFLLKEFTGIEAIGIRLKKEDDFPYFETNGYNKQFIEKENLLCAKNKNGKLLIDEKGNPVLECMCGIVLSANIDTNYPFFTNGGSYWTNSTTEILLSATDLERKIHIRNRCHQEGYESLALIPLKSGKNIIGLLQLNDKRKNFFNLDIIEFFEKIGDSIGIALERKNAEEELKNSEVKFFKAFHSNPNIMSILSLENNKFIDVNNTFLKILGYKKSEIIGNNPKELSIFVNNNDFDIALTILEKETKFDNLETSIYTKSKDIKNVIFFGEIIDLYDERCLLSVAVDITERNKAEKILKEREAEISSILKVSPIGIGVVKNRIFTEVNDKFSEMVGYKKEELINKDSIMVYPDEEEYDHVGKTKYQQIKNKGTGTVETKFKRKDGMIIEILLSSTPLDPNNISEGITFTALDITERNFAIKALKESEARFKELFNNMSNGVVVFKAVNDGEDFIIIDFNRGAEKIEKIKKEEILGKSLRLVFPGFKEIGVFEKILHVYQTGKPEYLPVSIYKDNRINIWRENYIYKLPSGEIVSVYEDVTERKIAEEQLIKLNEELENRVKQRTQQLEEVNSELESFSYSVSHDLRAPLRHIYGFSELLMKETKDQLKEKEDRYLNNIINSVKNMEKLINDILEFSRMGRSKLNYTAIDFSLLIDESKKILAEDIKNREITWAIKKLPKIKCDISMMKQVFINLISNALKYTRKRKNAEIEIGIINNNKNEITFYIKDNGVGFNMEYSDKLFGVFQRLHNDKEFEGTGIGLAIVKRIITRHGGKVWAEGKINKGATFYLTLPKK